MVFGVVTDNASNMKKAWRLVEEKYPSIICYRCAAHGLNLIFCNMIKLETCKNITKRAKDVIKKIRHKHMLVHMLKAMQKAENVNCTLKLLGKTRWVSMVTSLESVKKNKVMLRKIAVSEEPEKKSSNLSEVRRTLLDDTFWHESEAIVSLLKPLQSAITQLKEDFLKLADVCRLLFNFKCEILKSIDSFPFALSEQEKIKFIIEVREDFCIKIINKAAYFLDRVAAIEFVCKLAEKLSSCKMLDVSASKISEECALFSAKEGFFEKVFLWKNVSSTSPIAWWNGYCGRKTLNKIAFKILDYQQQAQLWNDRLAATQMSTQPNEMDYLMKDRQKLYLFPKT